MGKIMSIDTNDLKEQYFEDKDVPNISSSQNIDIPLNIVHDKTNIKIYVDLCGVKKESIYIELIGKILSIKATRKIESDALYKYFNEISTGDIVRMYSLEDDVDGENATTSFEDGLLKIMLPIKTQSVIINVN